MHKNIEHPSIPRIKKRMGRPGEFQFPLKDSTHPDQIADDRFVPKSLQIRGDVGVKRIQFYRFSHRDREESEPVADVLSGDVGEPVPLDDRLSRDRNEDPVQLDLPDVVILDCGLSSVDLDSDVHVVDAVSSD